LFDLAFLPSAFRFDDARALIDQVIGKAQQIPLA
jgi:hypothetical protein